MKTYLSAVIHFLRTFITTFPRTIYRHTISIILDFKGSQAFFHDILNAQDLRLQDKVIKSVNLVDVFNNNNVDIKIKGAYYKKKSSDTRDLFELANIAYLIKCIKPQIIFEFGTFVGRTARLFALNSGEDCKIYTIDLPQNMVSHTIGSDYKNTNEEKKIVQLIGDSTKFDFTPYYNSADFVWVDACHDYDYVKKDTENAIKICKQRGWIGWHDYRVTTWWSGVTKYVRQLSKEYPVMHIKGTTTAFMQKQ